MTAVQLTTQEHNRVMNRTGARSFSILGVLMALASAYGWWFHFSVGPTHGAGWELGTIAGVLAAVAVVCARRLGKRST